MRKEVVIKDIGSVSYEAIINSFIAPTNLHQTRSRKILGHNKSHSKHLTYTPWWNKEVSLPSMVKKKPSQLMVLRMVLAGYHNQKLLEWIKMNGRYMINNNWQLISNILHSRINKRNVKHEMASNSSKPELQWKNQRKEFHCWKETMKCWTALDKTRSIQGQVYIYNCNIKFRFMLICLFQFVLYACWYHRIG